MNQQTFHFPAYDKAGFRFFFLALLGMISSWTADAQEEAAYYKFDDTQRIRDITVIQLAKDMNKCLDLNQSNTANGTNIQLWDCNNTNAQQFEIY